MGQGAKPGLGGMILLEPDEAKRVAAPLSCLAEVGLPLGECLRRIGVPAGCLLANGRMWEGARMIKALAAGVTAVGLGRAALVASDEDDQ